jgi:hypothetical protein
MEHPPCSPDLDPNDFWLFLQTKSALKKRRLQDTKDIKKCDDSTESYSTTELQKYFQQWQHCWNKCTAAQCEYLEGDPSQQAV